MGFRLIGITAAVLGSGLLAGSVPMLARNTAVQLNGGLNVYRPAKCMFETAGAGNQCLISSSDGYQFRFLGGVPGWQQLDIAPSVETEIRISSDGKSVLGVDYNGAPR